MTDFQAVTAFFKKLGFRGYSSGSVKFVDGGMQSVVKLFLEVRNGKFVFEFDVHGSMIGAYVVNEETEVSSVQ